jgi:hypothetical protein
LLPGFNTGRISYKGIDRAPIIQIS